MLTKFRLPETAMAIAIALSGCSTDIYRSQGEAVQLHAHKFQSLLQREQVEAAMHETHAIELIGLQLKAGRLPGTDIVKAADLERQTRLLDHIREQAAMNWVALAQFFATRQQYAAARALYQRVIQSYAKGGDRLYGEYAKQALADMDLLSIAHAAENTASGRPALSALQEGRHP
jgi:hypothetical protein